MFFIWALNVWKVLINVVKTVNKKILFISLVVFINTYFICSYVATFQIWT